MTNKIDYNRNPVNVLVSGNFPSINRIDEDVRLNPKLAVIAEQVSHEFQKERSGEITRPQGKIPGWDGDYLSADKRFMDYARLTIIGSDQTMIPVPSIDTIDARVVRVSRNLASENFYMSKEGNHNNNPIAPMGIYIVPIIYDGKTPLMMFDKRPDDTFLDPGRLNSVSKALTVANSGTYLDSSLKELEKKYGITMRPDQVLPIGMTVDNVHNITHPLGYAHIPISQATDYNRNIIPDENIVPVKDMKAYLEKHSIESWSYTGFAAAYAAIAHGLDPRETASVRESFQKELDRLKTNPVDEKSSLELLGLNYLSMVVS